MVTTQQEATELQKKANQLILRRTLYAAGSGMLPVPGLDTATLLGVQVWMVRDLAQHYGVDFKEQAAKSVIATLLGDVAGASLFKFIPGLGTFFGGASMAVAGSATTYALGRVFAQHFAQGGTLLDFDPVKTRAFFEKELEKGQAVVSQMQTDDAPAGDESLDYAQMLARNQALLGEIATLRGQVAALRAAPQVTHALREVEGIGPKIEALLQAGGIHTMAQLAAAKVEDLQAILHRAGGNFKLASPDTWPEQAELIVRGDHAALKALQEGATAKRVTY